MEKKVGREWKRKILTMTHLIAFVAFFTVASKVTTATATIAAIAFTRVAAYCKKKGEKLNNSMNKKIRISNEIIKLWLVYEWKLVDNEKKAINFDLLSGMISNKTAKYHLRTIFCLFLLRLMYFILIVFVQRMQSIHRMGTICRRKKIKHTIFIIRFKLDIFSTNYFVIYVMRLRISQFNSLQFNICQFNKCEMWKHKAKG